MNQKPHSRWLTRGSTYVLMSVGVLGLDLVAGPYLLFPILFVIPVTLAAWYFSPRWAYALAVLLPVGRFLNAELIQHPSPFIYIVANAFIRMAVLLSMAYLVSQTAAQTRELRERFSGLAKVCAWSRTIEYEGEWISFEEYLKRRFNIDTSHGISPAEAQKALAKLAER